MIVMIVTPTWIITRMTICSHFISIYSSRNDLKWFLLSHGNLMCSSSLLHTHLLSFNVSRIGEITLNLSLPIITFAFVNDRELSAFVFSCLKHVKQFWILLHYLLLIEIEEKWIFVFIWWCSYKVLFYTNMFILMNSTVLHHRRLWSKV